MRLKLNNFLYTCYNGCERGVKFPKLFLNSTEDYLIGDSVEADDGCIACHST